MRISSIIDISLVDVPGIPVTVIFTAGCNYDCPFCQNAELIPKGSGEEMSIEDIVNRSIGHLSRGHCITGGEPTIHRDLPELLKALKDSGSGHLNLNTNGSVPSVLEKCLPFLDSIWLDVKTVPSKYREIARTKVDPWTNVENSLQMILESDVNLWPRTTYVGGLMCPSDIEGIVNLLQKVGFRGRYLVQNYVDSQGVREDERQSLFTSERSEFDYLLDLDVPEIEIELAWR